MPDKDANWDRQLEHVALTDVGMRRSNNQDAFAAVPAPDQQAWQDRGHFFVVADGMGAHAAGELASKLAVDGIVHRYRKYLDVSPPESLQRAIQETNGEVYRRGQENSDFHNMGTTASVLVLLPQGALVAHIGDSRIYRVRQGAIEQLTFDHSLVWELRKAGQLSSAGDSAHGIPKNVITRSIGPNATVQVDIEGPYPVHQGDVFLVCSDGLTGRVEDSELAAILSHLPIAEAGQLLIDLANLRGGPDNVTLIVAKVAGEALLTQTELSEPLRIGHTKDTRSTQLLVWVATSVLLLVGLVLAITDRYLPALVAVLVSVVCWFGGWIAKKRTEASGVSLAHGRRLGKGPYTKTAAPAIAEAVDLLGNLTRDVRQQESASSPIDWTRFDQLQQRAAESRAAGRSSAALGDYARAVRALMDEVREHASQHDLDRA